MDALLTSPRHRHVHFLPSLNQFHYRPRPDTHPQEWQRILGLTVMLRRAFWPEYDRNDPVILAAVQKQKQGYYQNRKRRRQRQRQSSNRGRSGGARGVKSTSQIQQLLQQKRAMYYGTQLGELVHKQLHVWAMDRYYAARPSLAPNRRPQFGVAGAVEWPPDPHTLALIRTIVQTYKLQVSYGELMIYDPRVPVATSIDLVAWSPRLRAVVVIEIKTGSKWNREMGNRRMRGYAGSQLGLNNAPLAQALVQLSVMVNIVQQVYELRRVEGLLLWATNWLDDRPDAPNGHKRVAIDGRWLSSAIKGAGSVFLSELGQHLQQRKAERKRKQHRRRQAKERKKNQS